MLYSLPTPTPSTGRCSNHFIVNLLLKSVVYYKKASAELAPPPGEACTSTASQNQTSKNQGDPLRQPSLEFSGVGFLLTLNFVKVWLNCFPVLRRYKQLKDGITSNTVIEAILKQQLNSLCCRLLFNKSHNLGSLITIPDYLHLITPAERCTAADPIRQLECYKKPQICRWILAVSEPTEDTWPLPTWGLLLLTLTRMLQKKYTSNPNI